MAFKRAEIREILGEAYTDEIADKLVTLHRGVVDPLKDDLDAAKRDATKYKADAEKLPDVQKKLDEATKDDWKGKFEKAEQDLKDYKAKVVQDAEVAKVKAAYRKLLTEEKISEKTLDAVEAVTDYGKMKLKDDGTLEGVEDLKKDIEAKWGGFRVTTRQRGQQVDNPPDKPAGGSDGSIRDYIRKKHEERFGAPQN